MTEPYDHHDIRRISFSGAKILLEPGGPAKYYTAMTTPETPTDAFDVGTSLHSKVLGIGKQYRVIPGEWRSAAAKAAVAEARADGLIPLHEEQAAQVEAMAESVLAHRRARKILEAGQPEVTVRWDDDEGTPWRGQIDWWAAGLGIIGDLKSTVDASPTGFPKSVWNYGYHLQAHAYTEAVTKLGMHEAPQFAWIVVEKSKPYLTACYVPEWDVMEAGREGCHRAAQTWRECKETGLWSGYSPDIEPLSLPRWAA